MRCASVSFYAAGAKLRPSQVSIRTENGLVRPASVRALETLLRGLPDAKLIVHTAHGDLVLPFSLETSKGRHGRSRFATAATLQEVAPLNPGLSANDVIARYVAAAFDAHPSELKEWPANPYSRKLLQLARTTYVNGRNLLGYDELGFDATGHDRRGFDAHGVHRTTGTRFDPSGFDAEHLSPSGLHRPQTWWDEVLDVHPVQAAYEATSTLKQYALARTVSEMVLSNIGFDPRQLTAAHRAEVLCSFGDGVVQTALNSVEAHLAANTDLVLDPHDDESPLEHGLRIAKWRADEELDFDIDLVAAAIERKLTGRFRAPHLPDLTVDRATLESLAGSVLVHTTAAVLSNRRRASHPTTRAATR